MTSLFEAINASGTTNNGAVTNISSLNKNVDLFFLAGASRNKDITHVFAAALAEDADLAVRILQWTRDVRGGAGERSTFRSLFGFLIKTDVALAKKLLPKVPELGRWDDLFVTFGTELEVEAMNLIKTALLVDQNGLAAKWMPRQGAEAAKIRKFLDMTPKQYRKLVVGLSSTVEQLMCAKEWNKIVYDHVPSVAAARYQKAFMKNDAVGYSTYKAQLADGTAKINAAAVYPYDVIRSLVKGDTAVAEAQWAALPNYLEGSDESILPLVDVSGSMSSVAVSGSVTAMDVSISLGLYLSERMGGAFKDKFITFSANPKMESVSGTLRQRYLQMSQSEWGMNTNIQKVFNLILNSAVKHSVSQSEMPTTLLILSDMEFDACTGPAMSASTMQMIEDAYRVAGYTIPKIVFWNLNGRSGNSPVTYNKTGAALVSGFSPSIVKSVLGAKNITPHQVMLDTVMITRYDY